jgi:hypothetical protein
MSAGRAPGCPRNAAASGKPVTTEQRWSEPGRVPLVRLPTPLGGSELAFRGAGGARIPMKSPLNEE